MRIFPEYEHPPPGPIWQPTVWDGKYPINEGDIGDIYINRYRDPPLYYVFYSRGDSQQITREELASWVTGGLMMLPIPDQSKPLTGPASSSTGSRVVE